MDMMEQLSRIGIVPVIAINDAADAVPLAQALIDGGLPCAEVTFRTAAAADAIKNMTEAFPDMVVGAGTVLTCEQVDRAVAAGAKFIVSPGLNLSLIHILSTFSWRKWRARGKTSPPRPLRSEAAQKYLQRRISFFLPLFYHVQRSSRTP